MERDPISTSILLSPQRIHQARAHHLRWKTRLMASSVSTRLLEKSWISPPPNSVPDTSVPLTTYDLPWLHTPPVHRLFFYPSSQPAAPFIESLESSLSLTLQHFYILAGTVHMSPNKVDIIYTNGDAIAFTVFESNSDFHHLASCQKRNYVTQVNPLVPQLSGLLAIQVTVFPEHGICIGITVRHVAGDGASIVGFLKSWASACKSGAIPETPIYDRGLIRESPQMFEAAYSYMKQSKSVILELPLPSKGTFLASFTLRHDQIERLKKRVRERCEHTHCSTFVISCAYAWVCYVRALGNISVSTAHFIFPVDCRGRLDPPLPPSYFGNCLTFSLVDESVSVLTAEDGIVAAAIAVGKAVEELKGGVEQARERLMAKVSRMSAIIDNGKLLSVAGAPKLGVYDVDFGWGRPVRVEMPSVQNTGGISLAETREGDGGVVIGVALEEGEMKEFEKQFSGGLATLSD